MTGGGDRVGVAGLDGYGGEVLSQADADAGAGSRVSSERQDRGRFGVFFLALDSLFPFLRQLRKAPFDPRDLFLDVGPAGQDDSHPEEERIGFLGFSLGQERIDQVG